MLVTYDSISRLTPAASFDRALVVTDSKRGLTRFGFH
jgi:hypothetical protein